MLAPIQIGRDEHGHDVYIDLRDPWHEVFQGMSRSGKSVLAYALLAQIAVMPEIAVCGADPTGILFFPWNQGGAPGWRASGTRNMSAVLAALDAVTAEMYRRVCALPSADLDKLSDFTAETPILLVILEEYPGLLSAAESGDEAEGRKPAERIAPKIRRDVRRLIQEGAKVGVRVVILAQRADASVIGGAERSNIGTRISMRVDNRDAVQMLHPSAPAELVDAMGQCKPGQGIIDQPNQRLRRLKVDYIDYPGYLARVRAAYPPVVEAPDVED